MANHQKILTFSFDDGVTQDIRLIEMFDRYGLKGTFNLNSGLIAPRNYESAGFVLYDRKPNRTESAYTGDYLWYEIIL